MFHLYLEMMSIFSRTNAVKNTCLSVSYVIRVERTIVNVVAGSSQQHSTYLHHQRW